MRDTENTSAENESVSKELLWNNIKLSRSPFKFWRKLKLNMGRKRLKASSKISSQKTRWNSSESAKTQTFIVLGRSVVVDLSWVHENILIMIWRNKKWKMKGMCDSFRWNNNDMWLLGGGLLCLYAWLVNSLSSFVHRANNMISKEMN